MKTYFTLLCLFFLTLASLFLGVEKINAQTCSGTCSSQIHSCNRIDDQEWECKSSTVNRSCYQGSSACVCTVTTTSYCQLAGGGTGCVEDATEGFQACGGSSGGGDTGGGDCVSEPANNVTGFKCSGSCTQDKECKKSGNDCKCIAVNANPPLPPSCTPTSPSAINLIGPSDGSNVVDPTITLSWNAVASWGTGCPQNNHYRVYVEAGDSTPDVLVAGIVTTSYNYAPAAGQTYYWQIIAHNGSSSRASAVYSFTTISASQDAWWQVIDGDVSASGSVISPAPDGEFFNLDGPGGYPGVVSYLGSADFSQSSLDSGVVSSTGWLTESSYLSLGGKVYDSSYLRRLIPPDTVITTIESASVVGAYFESGGTLSDGYYWYRYDGGGVSDLIISSAMDLGSRKVILLVDNADLYLNGSVNLTDGSGFFMTVVGETAGGLKGDIVVDPLVGASVGADLEGIYVADNEIMTGAGTSQLYFRGSVAAYGGIVLERDLTDNSVEAAEVFEYAPDLVFNYPSALNTRKIRWREVAP